ncbi:MAG: alpha/beta fold hydrolase [Chloroflexi bacterium]|nr:alpha/beta fold hydrolase [Chloroflexota bacterium]
MPRTLINGTHLYYEEHGSGTPIILTHGFAGTTRMWDPQIPVLSQGYRLILHDLRGHGQSDAPSDLAQYSWDIVIEDIYQLLRNLGVRQAIVGGLSLGGLVSLHFYIRHPEMTKALILMDTGPGFRNPESRAAWDRERLRVSAVLEKGGMVAFMVSPYSENDYYTSPDIMVSLNPVGLSNINRALQTNQEMVPLEKVTVPTLVIVGQNDTAAIAPANYMHRKIQGSRMAVVPGAGHGSNMDQPEIFNRAILDFLKDHNL